MNTNIALILQISCAYIRRNGMVCAQGYCIHTNGGLMRVCVYKLVQRLNVRSSV